MLGDIFPDMYSPSHLALDFSQVFFFIFFFAHEIMLRPGLQLHLTLILLRQNTRRLGKSHV